MFYSRERDLRMWWASPEWIRAWPARARGQRTLQREMKQFPFPPHLLHPYSGTPPPGFLNLVPIEEGVRCKKIKDLKQHPLQVDLPTKDCL